MTHAQRYGYNHMLRTLKEIAEIAKNKDGYMKIMIAAKRATRNKKPIEL